MERFGPGQAFGVANLVGLPLNMSTEHDIQGNEAADPHGIDHARERKLAKVFAGLIGAGFVLVLIMLSIAIALDATTEEVVISGPPPELQPSSGASGSHP
jgi:hypothetical protein